MNKQILEAIIMRYQAQKAEAMTNLNIYLTGAVGVGEHPNIVSECDKLIQKISEADGNMKMIQTMVKESEAVANAEEAKK